MAIPADLLDRLVDIVGPAGVFTDATALDAAADDRSHRNVRRPDVVVRPGTAAEIGALLRLCTEHRVPVVPRGTGTGYTGGAIPVRGGIVVAMDRFDRIVEIDEANLLAVVEPFVVTGVLQEAVERVGLFYPPDPASLAECSIGGNVAENAGGPRAFKYGVTRQYVLGLEAVIPTGEIVHTGGRTVKNVAGYDLTQLLVGSEGTLAIITKIILRLVPKPPARTTLRAAFPDVSAAVRAVSELVRERVVPATIELVDRDSLDAVAEYVQATLAPRGTGAILLIDVDGLGSAIEEEAARAADACRRAGASQVLRAASPAEREELWHLRRQLSPALTTIPGRKFNHDIVVPKGRIPELFAIVARLRETFGFRIPCFGHAGDGNIHVNIMAFPDDEAGLARAAEAEQQLLEGVVALGGSITGEHGVGLTKQRYLRIQLSDDEMALMRRVKEAFDPAGILNPGKMFPDPPGA